MADDKQFFATLGDRYFWDWSRIVGVRGGSGRDGFETTRVSVCETSI